MVATADLWDDHASELDSLGVQLRDLGGRASFEGPVRTIRCYRDNGLIKKLLATPGNGAVLIVDGRGCLDSALVGDKIGASAVQNGWAGVIIYGAVRDSVELGKLDLGVKALGTNPRTSDKDSRGEQDIPVTFGNVTFRPGSFVWADPDGVLVGRG